MTSLLDEQKARWQRRCVPALQVANRCEYESRNVQDQDSTPQRRLVTLGELLVRMYKRCSKRGYVEEIHE